MAKHKSGVKVESTEVMIRPKRSRVSSEDFLASYIANQGQASKIAAQLNIKEASVEQRVYSLRKRNIDVPRYAKVRKNAVNATSLNQLIKELQAKHDSLDPVGT